MKKIKKKEYKEPKLIRNENIILGRFRAFSRLFNKLPKRPFRNIKFGF